MTSEIKTIESTRGVKFLYDKDITGWKGENVFVLLKLTDRMMNKIQTKHPEAVSNRALMALFEKGAEVSFTEEDMEIKIGSLAKAAEKASAKTTKAVSSVKTGKIQMAEASADKGVLDKWKAVYQALIAKATASGKVATPEILQKHIQANAPKEIQSALLETICPNLKTAELPDL